MRRRKWMALAIVISAAVAFIWNAVIEEKKECQYIRFHVIANSDSPEDQALKIRVRDLILERFQDQFGKADSIQTSRGLIESYIDEIEEIAQREVKRSGETYQVKAQLGAFDFPTKAYGNLVLPAGNYEALRVVIGDGGGANWWCVMFPPLCFVDITHGVAKERDTYQGSNTGTILSSVDKGGGVQVEYKLKIGEWWDSSKADLKKIFSFLYK